MDKTEKTAFLAEHPVPRETLAKLEMFAEMVVTTNREQNLISRNTEGEFWTRHLLDSAQLIGLMPTGAKTCLDVGSGAGLPGIVLAIMTNAQMTLVEPRRLRADFLKDAANRLDLMDRVEIVPARVQSLTRRTFDVITARAFASLSETLGATRHLAKSTTCWLLPKGRTAAVEIADASAAWNARFEATASKTAADAGIVRVSEFKGARR